MTSKRSPCCNSATFSSYSTGNTQWSSSRHGSGVPRPPPLPSAAWAPPSATRQRRRLLHQLAEQGNPSGRPQILSSAFTTCASASRQGALPRTESWPKCWAAPLELAGRLEQQLGFWPSMPVLRQACTQTLASRMCSKWTAYCTAVFCLFPPVSACLPACLPAQACADAVVRGRPGCLHRRSFADSPATIPGTAPSEAAPQRA